METLHLYSAVLHYLFGLKHCDFFNLLSFDSFDTRWSTTGDDLLNKSDRPRCHNVSKLCVECCGLIG